MINPMNILNFIKTHFREIIKVGFGIFILYWMLYILTPSISMSKNEKQNNRFFEHSNQIVIRTTNKT